MHKKLSTKFLTNKIKRFISFSLFAVSTFSIASPIFCQELTSCAKRQVTWLDYFIDPGIDVRYQEATELKQKMNFHFELKDFILEDENLEFNFQVVDSSHEDIDIVFSQPELDARRKSISFDAEFNSVPPDDLNNEISSYWVEFTIEVICKKGDKTIWNTTIDDLQLMIETESPLPFSGNFLSIEPSQNTTICIKVENQTVNYNEKAAQGWIDPIFKNRIPKMHYWSAEDEKWVPVDFANPRITYDTHHWTQTYTFNIQTSYENPIIYLQGWVDKNNGLSCYEFNAETNISNSSKVSIISGKEDDKSEWTLGGTAMSLLNRGSGQMEELIDRPGCFYGLFEGNENIKTISNPETFLSAKNLSGSNFCYLSMFKDCTNLIAAPQLPASTLAKYCYRNMFSGCIKLTEAPELKCTNLAPHCYEQMFDVSGLTSAPELPAQKLADYCYANMFHDCDQIGETPTLASTQLADYCYYSMFANCDNLVNADGELPATQLKASCYDHMFFSCKELISAPEIKGELYALNCYNEMFADCSNLTVKEEQNTNQDNLICRFNEQEQILPIANEMFRDCIGQPSEFDTPRPGYSYYWVE